MGDPQLLKDIHAGKVNLFLQFGGQGSPWIDEVQTLYQEPHMKKFFDVVLTSLEEEIQLLGQHITLPQGFPVREWISSPDSHPTEEYQSIATISLTMIQVAQLARFEHLTQTVIPRKDLLSAASGATGHSQGMISASFVAMNLPDDEYYKALALYTKFIFNLGVRTQEAYPYVTAESEPNLPKDADPFAAPMIAILGEWNDIIQESLDEINSDFSLENRIYLSLINSPLNRILSSRRASLIKFCNRYTRAFENEDLKLLFINTTCPFHSSYMEPIREAFENDCRRIGFNYSGSNLKLPVFSYYDGRDIRNDDLLGQGLYIDMSIHPLFWHRAIMPVVEQCEAIEWQTKIVENPITHIIDFGPGKTTHRFTTETLAPFRDVPIIYAAAHPKDYKKIIAE